MDRGTLNQETVLKLSQSNDITSAIEGNEASLQKYTGDFKVLYALDYWYTAINKFCHATIYYKRADDITSYVLDIKSNL